MAPRHLIYAICVASCALLFQVAFSQSPAGASSTAPSSQAKNPPDGGNRIYGSQLMTPEERTVYIKKIREAKTPEERQKLRAEHRKDMQARAKEKGITLPDRMPSRQHQRGMGSGMGPMGPGMGPNAPQENRSGTTQ